MISVHRIYPKSLKYLSSHLLTLVRGRLWLKVMIGLIAGIGVGLVVGEPVKLLDSENAALFGDWAALPGQIFLTLIQMIVVPLVFASVIRGLASSEDMDQLKKLGSRIVIYFLFTTTIAITIGVGIATLIKPGNYVQALTDSILEEGAETVDVDVETAQSADAGSLPEVIVDILPENPLVSMVEKEMLQVVLFAVILGLALIVMAPEQAKIILELLGAIQEICMTVVRWAMLLAPLAVFGLMARITIKIGIDALLGMAAYVGTVLLGLFLLLVFYVFIITLLGRKNPFSFLKKIRDVQLLAFSTSSSAAVMPLSMETAEEKLGVRSSISQFLIPLGATINMDGTALYQGAATVFLAQVYGVELGMTALLLIVATSVGASIGSPATPGVGIVILATVLRSVGIPASGVALIIGVDRILDMSRTMLNVTGDLTACVVMDRIVGGKKSAMDERLTEAEIDKRRRETQQDVMID
ncbi:MAG: dicarboxylate/amino acid:cation symporter [candidate division KSB1 bacterium]|jgi:Na+/H+-dicarboxylate symporter|nr:dicarboxylate/amino acid:cation symporter [candidate division KSB1 bacterium]